jgi:hypothetical protein
VQDAVHKAKRIVRRGTVALRQGPGIATQPQRLLVVRKMGT